MLISFSPKMGNIKKNELLSLNRVWCHLAEGPAECSPFPTSGTAQDPSRSTSILEESQINIILGIFFGVFHKLLAVRGQPRAALCSSAVSGFGGGDIHT